VAHDGEEVVWLIILGTAAVTFALRFSFLGTVKPHSLPPLFQEALRFVPAAVFAAIVAPQVLIRDEALHLAPDNPRLLAALAALAVAWFTRSVTWTLVGGMVALWLVQWWVAR
jgi:branched-subunit amino acid transport protein